MNEVDLGHYTLEEVRRFWDHMVARNPLPPSDPGALHVFFRIGQQWFALDSSVCKGVEPYRKPSPLPVMPQHIMGVAAVRGRPVAVTNLGIFFGIRNVEEGGHLLIIGSDGEETALKTDWVDRVGHIREWETEAVPEKFRGMRTGLASRITYKKNSMVLILDPGRCMKAAESA